MEGTPKAIEMKGIVRNATKIGVQDGQAEDLINLRFVDGSWRASGDGRLVHTMSGTIYEQLYVHTNVYHHLLGVNNGTLYWFADIASDGVSFYPLKADKTGYPADMQDLPNSPVVIASVTGDVWIEQTGHLLTIIDEADAFEFSIYKTGTKTYKKVDSLAKGNPSDRKLFPYGNVRFNYYSPSPSHILVDKREINIAAGADSRFFKDSDLNTANHPYVAIKECSTDEGYNTWKDKLYTAVQELVGGNKFVNPFMALLAIRLYDGTYAYASNPVLIYPRQNTSNHRHWFDAGGNQFDFSAAPNYDASIYPLNGLTADTDGTYVCLEAEIESTDSFIVSTKTNVANLIISRNRYIDVPDGTYVPYKFNKDIFPTTLLFTQNFGDNQRCVVAQGCDLTLSVDFEYLKNVIEENKDIFQSLCVFVTPQVPGSKYNQSFESDLHGALNQAFLQRNPSDVKTDLMNQPFFLLKEYKLEDLGKFSGDSIIVDLSGESDKNILKNIALQPSLLYEATNRRTYLPKCVYQYNGRLHIANYKAFQYEGFPLECFHLSGHSVYKTNGAIKDSVKGLALNADTWRQGNRVNYIFSQPAYVYSFNYKAYICVELDIDGVTQKVVRYIANDYASPGGSTPTKDNFIEALNPILTYPDSRAKKMTIVIARQNALGVVGVEVYKKEFTLTPHPIYNMAYYASPDLMPIELTDTTNVGNTYLQYPTPDNEAEVMPNGLKVSATDNPLYFPVETTYKIGNSKILAMCSNNIAVGTGQTGDAPLYVFCEDGVYALYVDSSGQMAYPNARILARDVCNNPRSVTPIDAGVVFTTDRGLMMIAGEQVQEKGAPAEGDVVQFWNAGSVDYSKIATASMQQIAGLPSELCSTTDFLTYLQDKGTSGKAAIINYNHNMRELMVSNPNYPYSYVLDREGNWSRRNYTAAQYVNNYPTSYRVDKYGHFYKVDDEGDENTSLEHRKEADNKIFYLSNVIKLDSIGFKQAYRFVVRGYFETKGWRDIWLPIGSMAITTNNRYADNILYNLTSDIYNSIEVGDNIRIVSSLSQQVMDEVVATTKSNSPNSIQFSSNLNVFSYAGNYVFQKLIHIPKVGDGHLACVVEGSYDGRKFKPLGYNRKAGKFRDIGCIVERTDVRFFRICLSGQVTGKTRIDYMEMSAGASMLNTKIR